MHRLAIYDAVVALVLCLWFVSGAALVAPLLERQAQAVIGMQGNTCQAPPIPGTGCPVAGNACAGPCAGTGWTCQAARGTCTKGPAGCSTAGPPACWCAAFSC